MNITILRKYFIYGMLGLCLEVFWTGLESLFRNDFTLEGRTYIWMFFIYGLAVFLEPVHNKLRNHNHITRGIIYMLLIFIAEFITGLILKSLIGKCPWNYTDFGSINGVITLYFIPVWFSLGLILEKVHDFLGHLNWINEKNYK